MKRSTRITDAVLRRWPLPEPDGTLGKEGRGTVLVVGGSAEIPGAVMLAAIGALRAGAGKLQIATSRSVAQAVAIAIPEARVIGLEENRRGELARRCWRGALKEASRCDALLVGPGMFDAAAAAPLSRRCLKGNDGPILVLDAGAISIFSDAKVKGARRDPRAIVTPHAGEMANLLGIPREQVLERPLEIAREAAARFGIIVALKGACTYIAAPDGTTFHNTAGNVGLGTSGSGDTLSGVIAGLCARGANPFQATVWGVFLHAKAGDVLARKTGPLGFLARELLDEIPPVLGQLTGDRRKTRTR